MDATLALLSAALEGRGALEAALGVSVAEGRAGFPEALPIVSSDAVQILAGLDAGDEVILSDMSRYADHESLHID